MPALPTRSTRAARRAVPRNRSHRGSLAALAALLAALAVAPSTTAATPTYKGASGDGSVVFFESEDQLVPGDTDIKRDVYVRSFDPDVGEAGGEYVTRQVSVGPAGGNDGYHAQFDRASADGSKVFLSTEEALVAGDTDKRVDVYLRDIETGTTALVSVGAAGCAPGCGNGAADTAFAAAPGDATEVFLVTPEPLDPAVDKDAALDIYVREIGPDGSGATELVSAGAAGCAPGCGQADADATLRGISADGTIAIFVSAEKLTGADTDDALDIFARDTESGTTTLVSQGAAACAPGCGNGGQAPVYRGRSASGTRVFFTTDEALVEGDADGATDIYARDIPGGPTDLVSAGVDPEKPASFAAIASDGSEALFSTTEALVGADTNGATDVYRWSGGAPSLVTSGTCTPGSECGSKFDAATADAATVLFTTTEQLDGLDTDSARDIYAQEAGGGSPVRVSAGAAACAPGCGNGDLPAIFNGMSADASRVLFTTAEQLAPPDGDAVADVYARDAGSGTTTLMTPPPGLCPVAACPATFLDASADGAHVFFQTVEWLSAQDTDNEADIYERAYDADAEAEVTRLVSTENLPGLELGPAAPTLDATDPPSPSESTEPAVIGAAEEGSFVKLYATPDCSGEPIATGSAAELEDPGLPTTVAVNTTTSFRATAEAEGFTSLCSSPLSYKQEEPPPSGGDDDDEGGNGAGGEAAPAPGSASAPAPAPAPPPLTHSGGIPYVVPFSRITYGPAFKTRRRRPVFRFTDATGQPGTRFICRVDRRRWRRCGSPLRLRGLGRGRHVLRVKARNAAGVWEPRLSKRRFKMVRGDGKRRKGRRGGRRGRR